MLILFVLADEWKLTPFVIRIIKNLPKNYPLSFRCDEKGMMSEETMIH
jgi:hypothetical protein